MAIHNEAMVRVVSVARGVGALLIAGGLLTVALPVVSAIRHPFLPFPWMSVMAGLCGGPLAGGMLLVVGIAPGPRACVGFLCHHRDCCSGRDDLVGISPC